MNPLKSSTPKGMSDVVRPGDFPADQTSKPVITNNQPPAQDPMMTDNPTVIPDNRIPEKVIEHEMNQPSNPVAEHGTLHNMFPEDKLVGHVPRRKKLSWLRNLFLFIGFLLTLGGLAYYVLVFLNT